MQINVTQDSAGESIKFNIDIPDGLINIKRVKPLKIIQITAGTFHLTGDTELLEDELKSLGCELLETKDNNSVWYFTKNKQKAVEAVVGVVNKLR